MSQNDQQQPAPISSRTIMPSPSQAGEKATMAVESGDTAVSRLPQETSRDSSSPSCFNRDPLPQRNATEDQWRWWALCQPNSGMRLTFHDPLEVPDEEVRDHNRRVCIEAIDSARHLRQLLSGPSDPMLVTGHFDNIKTALNDVMCDHFGQRESLEGSSRDRGYGQGLWYHPESDGRFPQSRVVRGPQQLGRNQGIDCAGSQDAQSMRSTQLDLLDRVLTGLLLLGTKPDYTLDANWKSTGPSNPLVAPREWVGYHTSLMEYIKAARAATHDLEMEACAETETRTSMMKEARVDSMDWSHEMIQWQ